MKHYLPMFFFALFIVGCTSINYDLRQEKLSIQSIEDTLLLAGEYLIANQAQTGYIGYSYHPDNELFSSSNNAIRQFMTSTALYALYERTQDVRYLDTYAAHVDYNINEMYVTDENFAYIDDAGKIKLGAAAVAHMAISHSDQYFEEKQELLDFILFMRMSDTGKFYTFYQPFNEELNQRFYSGEALLALILEYQRTRSEELLTQIEESMSFYRGFFVDENKRPAFVPWHSQVLYHLYQETGKDEYAAYLLDINEWLIGELLENDCSVPEHVGRFYNPDKPYHGVPHASSTAVYMEGISYAYRVAEQLDDQRLTLFRDALLYGASSLQRLQYIEQDIAHRSDKDILLGGIRTTASNGDVRIDNNQHTIMALLNLLDVLDQKDVDSFLSENSNFNCKNAD